jgi:hypothetical protein
MLDVKRRHARRRQHTLATLAVVCASILALGGAAAAAPDSKGTDHWLMFTDNVGAITLSLFVTADTDTSGTVSIPGLSVSTPFSVTAGTVTTVPIPATAEVTAVDVVGDLGIRVTALDEVTVYGLSQAPQTTDAFLGLPTDVLGTEHVVLAWGNSAANFNQGSQFGIVAVQDATTVTITPSSPTAARPAGDPFTVSMNAGQTYQLRTTFPGEDLSGTIVSSDKPVGVFGGHLCANVPLGVPFCDHVVEQIPASDTWGESFVTMPLAQRLNGDTFRFLASTADTEVRINGTLVATLDRGEVHEQIVSGAADIEATKPILVAQYSNGTNFDGVTSDPFMMLIPPSEQFLADYTITTPAVVFQTNFVNVVAPTAAVGSILLDGTAIPSASFTPIGSSGFSGAQVAIVPGSHRLTGSLPFGVFTYGFASFDSYGYPGGASFSPVAGVSQVSLEPETSTRVVGNQHCVTATVTDQNGGVLDGIRVDFTVSGQNTATGFAFTSAAGLADFCYTGANLGNDLITASVGSVTDTATQTWTEAPWAATLVLTPESATNIVPSQHCVTAGVTDQFNAAFPDAQVVFSVTGTHTAGGTVGTGATGLAEFCYPGTLVGMDSIRASVGDVFDTATKTWILEPARPTTLTLAPPHATNVVGTPHCVTATLRDQRGDALPGTTVGFAVTGVNPTTGSAVTGTAGDAQFCYTGSVAGPDLITATVGSLTTTATKTWTSPPVTRETVFLVLDDESRGKGKPLWAAKPGDVLTVSSGQTGDEGWFAPTCIPRKWLGGSSDQCLEGAERETAIDNVVGINGKSSVPKESRLDNVPAMMPLRALGLGSLVGKEACALVHDSDVSLNYDKTSFPFTTANLQGKTRGPVAFRIDAVETANGSSSTLPSVRVTVLESSKCGGWVLFNAPVPRSSSEPSDTRVAGQPTTGKKGYLQLKTWPLKDLVF